MHSRPPEPSYRALLILLALALAGTVTLWAQAYGRVLIKVIDEQGQPIAGATVVATCKELPRFRDEQTTKRRGEVTLAFADATKFYDVRVEAEGYRPALSVVKAELRQTIKVEITLQKPGAAAPGGAEQTGQRVYSPSETVFNAGVGLMRQGDLEAAEAKFEEALGMKSEMAGAWAALAAVRLERANPQGALEAARRFLELSPGSPHGYRTLYEAHRALGNDAEAEAALAELSELDREGDAPALLYNEGVEALRVGDRSAAKSRFREAIELAPGLAAAHRGLATILLEDEEHAAAASAAERALELEPGHAATLELRYRAYRALGDADRASAALAAWAATDPAEVSRQFFGRGVELFNGGDAAAAIIELERALEVDPRAFRAHYYLGLSFVSRGDSAAAKRHLQTFLEMAPDDPEAGAASEMLKYLD